MSVTQETEKVTDTPRRQGFQVFGTTLREEEILEVLLQPHIRTYADAAKRLDVTEAAVKQRMSRLYARYSRAKQFTNQVEVWKRKRRENRSDNPGKKHGRYAATREVQGPFPEVSR
ncbi:MAG: hypothetical protein KGO96_13045 [Elusimicrobia bacterium]|nr:hypothetical protein [Elusimicrobiota bacterium]MDE2426820.1 hypothetical protein [Elusimicrobiota bacterium]